MFWALQRQVFWHNCIIFRFPSHGLSSGTGKTGAFGIPILQLIHENLRQESIEKSHSVEAISAKEPTAFKMSMEDKEVCCC